MVDEPGGGEAAGTGGAAAGAGEGQTAGSAGSGAGEGQTAISSVDQVPEGIKQQIFDRGYGKAMQSSEGKFMETYGDHIELAKMIAGQSDLPDDVLDAILDMPGLSGRAKRELAEKIAEGTPVQDDALKREVDQLKQGMVRQQQSGWVQTVHAKVDELAGDQSVPLNQVKRNLIMAELNKRFTDVNTPSFTVEDIPKVAEEIDQVLLQVKGGVKSDYIAGKEKGKSAGAEGSAGSPPSPGKAETAGEFGEFDTAFSESVVRDIETGSEI